MDSLSFTLARQIFRSFMTKAPLSLREEVEVSVVFFLFKLATRSQIYPRGVRT